MKKEEEEIESVCTKCGERVIWDPDHRAYWYEFYYEYVEGKSIQMKRRVGTCWRHKNGGLFDNKTNCSDPTPMNRGKDFMFCSDCGASFDSSKEGKRFYVKSIDAYQALCGHCEVKR